MCNYFENMKFNWNRKLEIIKENILKENFLLMRLYDWAMMIISYFFSFSYNRTMKIWKQKKKERMSLRLGLNLWWPNWLRRSLIIKRKGGACEEEAGNNSSHSYSLMNSRERRKGKASGGSSWILVLWKIYTRTRSRQRN